MNIASTIYYQFKNCNRNITVNRSIDNLRFTEVKDLNCDMNSISFSCI